MSIMKFESQKYKKVILNYCPLFFLNESRFISSFSEKRSCIDVLYHVVKDYSVHLQIDFRILMQVFVQVILGGIFVIISFSWRGEYFL